MTSEDEPASSLPAPYARPGGTFLSIAAELLGAGWLSISVGMRWVGVVSLLGVLLLWPVRRGHRWARWLLVSVLFPVGGVLLLSAMVGIFERVDPGLVSGILLLTAAGTLFASGRIDSLGRPGSTLTWLSVAAAPGRSPRAYALNPRWFRFLSFWCRLMSVIGVGSVGIVWFGLVIGIVFFVATVSSGPPQDSHEPITAGYAVAIVAGLVCLIGVVITIAVMFALALPVALLWKAPLRFLLLRPFNRPSLSRALTRVVKRELKPFGHCYTLADANLRVSPWRHIPVILGPLSLFAFRQRRILYPKDLAAFVDRMSQTVRRNLNWQISRSGLFPVACSESAWRACVKRVVDEVDVVILDCSGGGQALEWEMKYLSEAAAFPKTIVLSDGEGEEDLERALRVFPPHVHPMVVLYGPTGEVPTGAMFDAVLYVAQRG
jgi:hypothetical protein